MEHIYLLKHSRKIDDECKETKIIGFFSVNQNAEEVIENYKKLPGFKDNPDDFIIEKIQINHNDWEFEKDEN